VRLGNLGWGGATGKTSGGRGATKKVRLGNLGWEECDLESRRWRGATGKTSAEEVRLRNPQVGRGTFANEN